MFFGCWLAAVQGWGPGVGCSQRVCGLTFLRNSCVNWSKLLNFFLLLFLQLWKRDKIVPSSWASVGRSNKTARSFF